MPSQLPAAEAPYHCAAARSAHLLELGERPRVKAPLFSFAVGVLGRGPRSFRQADGRRQQVPDRLFDHLAVAGRARELPCVRVRNYEQRIVVEHFFEMGDEPVPVGAVPGKAAGEMVVDAARAHGVERARKSFERPFVAGPPPVLGQQLRGSSLEGTWALGRSHPIAGHTGSTTPRPLRSAPCPNGSIPSRPLPSGP